MRTSDPKRIIMQKRTKGHVPFASQVIYCQVIYCQSPACFAPLPVSWRSAHNDKSISLPQWLPGRGFNDWSVWSAGLRLYLWQSKAVSWSVSAATQPGLVCTTPSVFWHSEQHSPALFARRLMCFDIVSIRVEASLKLCPESFTLFMDVGWTQWRER